MSHFRCRLLHGGKDRPSGGQWSEFVCRGIHFIRLQLNLCALCGRVTQLQRLLESLGVQNSNQNKRAAALLGLPHFMKEDPSNFIKFCQASDSKEGVVTGVDVGVLIVREDGEEAVLPNNVLDVSVILEGHIVLNELSDVPSAFSVLVGLLYSLNIDYPKGLKYTFEVLQKVLMDVGGGTCSAHALGLRNKLLQGTL
ncbi:hypothetical protein J4Q44_G00006970 [Coregonus suidteri]|uniref:Uncharacterized protein n=1 Tax=Coregonus suidteri TaxID=861788 RepID=A0AAN8MD87_9TELE